MTWDPPATMTWDRPATRRGTDLRLWRGTDPRLWRGTDLRLWRGTDLWLDVGPNRDYDVGHTCEWLRLWRGTNLRLWRGSSGRSVRRVRRWCPARDQPSAAVSPARRNRPRSPRVARQVMWRTLKTRHLHDYESMRQSNSLWMAPGKWDKGVV